ncbi:hypothetical protein [Budvicia diplopodorum]|uniref:hypothetical protein n=1 Tax=Budvicia diplopodorum TaxID=1119056 RepID=UPI00135B8302|nr:hypothetical protein [Budvicia diplopodorum]
MNIFEKLNAMLSSDENEYYENDYFLDAERQIARLSENNLPRLLAAWQNQNTEWWNRFAQSSTHIPQPVLRQLLMGTITAPTTSHKNKIILSLLNRLPHETDGSELSHTLVNYAAKLWRAEPGLRLQIQMSTWHCGLSPRLLEKLGFGSWHEAGL